MRYFFLVFFLPTFLTSHERDLSFSSPHSHSHITSLSEFPTLPKGSIVILDIDDTLIIRQEPSMKALGIRYKKELEEKTSNPLLQEMILAALFTHLKVELVEGEKTRQALNSLRDQAKYVFALTSRPASDFHAPTGPFLIQQLKELGLDFSPTILGRDFSHYQEENLEYQFHDGVIFGARQPKGRILLHFLEQMRQRPSFLLLIDDFEGGNQKLQRDVEKSLSSFCPGLCLMYTKGTERRKTLYSKEENDRKIRKFISEGIWEDDEASFHSMIPYSVLVKYFDIFEEHLSQFDNLHFPHSPVMIGISGTPGMGKSTLARVVEDKYQAIRISSDQLRNLLREKQIAMAPKEMDQYLYAMMHYILAHYPNQLIIVDSALERKVEILNRLLDQFHMEHLWVRLDVSKEEALRRIDERDLAKEGRRHGEKQVLRELLELGGYYEEYVESGVNIDFDLIIENETEINPTDPEEITLRFLEPIEQILQQKL